MFFFGRNKKDRESDIPENADNENTVENATEDEIDTDNGAVTDDDELMKEFREEEEDDESDEYDDSGADADDPENENEDEDSQNDTDVQVTAKCTSVDMLAEFANVGGGGMIQFMKKETLELFELKEVHLRIAEVWGSVSMARQYSDAEYALIMLAIEVKKDPDAFLILPGLTDKELSAAISDFCLERFSENGKKYAKNIDKFSKLLRENDALGDWKEYTKALLYDKMTAFCESNGITFDTSDGENGEETDE